MATNRSVHELSDDELEDCIDGSSNLDMIRDILTKHKVVNDQGYVDAENFADWFAMGVEGYIDAEVDSEEWNEANQNNWDWGYDIADAINDLISEDQGD